jgi:hypothetical protein
MRAARRFPDRFRRAGGRSLHRVEPAALRLCTLEEMEQAIRRGSRGRKPTKAVSRSLAGRSRPGLFGNRWYQPSQRANKVPETIAGAIWTSAIAAYEVSLATPQSTAGRGQIDQNLALICKAQQSGKFVSSAEMPTPGIVNLAARPRPCWHCETGCAPASVIVGAAGLAGVDAMGRRGVCGRTEKAGRPEPPWGQTLALIDAGG